MRQTGAWGHPTVEEPRNPSRTAAYPMKALSWSYPRDSCCYYSRTVTTWKHLKFRECWLESQKTLFGEPRQVKWDKEKSLPECDPSSVHGTGKGRPSDGRSPSSCSDTLPLGDFSSIWWCLTHPLASRDTGQSLWSILVLFSMALKGFYFHF